VTFPTGGDVTFPTGGDVMFPESVSMCTGPSARRGCGARPPSARRSGSVLPATDERHD